MAKELLAPTTSAAQSSAFQARAEELPAMVSADNLASAEEARLQININGSWLNVVDHEETTYVLKAAGASPSGTVVPLPGPGWYRVDKDATAGACGIFLHMEDNV